MSLQLSINDTANGGDFVATVSGITGGSVQLYYQPLEVEPLLVNTWHSIGSPITVNGTINASMPAIGYYWFRAEQTNGGAVTQSNFVRAVIKGANRALYAQCGDAIQARLQDAITAGAFPGITDPSRVKQVYEYIPEVFPANVPGIAVVVNGRKLPLGGSNEEDDKAFPIQIVVATRGTSNTPVRDEDVYFSWQEAVESLFLHQRMFEIIKSGIPINTDNDISYPDAVNFLKQNYQDVRVALQVNIKLREPRGP